MIPATSPMLAEIPVDASFGEPRRGCGLRLRRASRGILTRLFDAPASLRFGLPPDEAGIVRLDAALAWLSGVNRCEP